MSLDESSIKALLLRAKKQLADVTDTAQLDAEILLAHVLHESRVFLYTRPENIIPHDQIVQFQEYIARRCQGEPIAYLIGVKEFWSLEFQVTRDTLIPRPETELLVELVLHRVPLDKKITLADLGTGSGAIAIALAHERPAWEIHATDNNEKTLQVARQNADQLQMRHIRFHFGSWCGALPAIKFDVIVSNPPYIAQQEWKEYGPGLALEPVGALVSPKNGLGDIEEIIVHAKHFLQPGGYLFLEHGFRQGQDVRALLAASNYSQIETVLDMASKERITLATYCNG